MPCLLAIGCNHPHLFKSHQAHTFHLCICVFMLTISSQSLPDCLMKFPAIKQVLSEPCLTSVYDPALFLFFFSFPFCLTLVGLVKDFSLTIIAHSDQVSLPLPRRPSNSLSMFMATEFLTIACLLTLIKMFGFSR